MEYLTRVLAGLKNMPNFNYHPRFEKLNILNLCFADDLLFFARADLIYVRLSMKQFGEFS